MTEADSEKHRVLIFPAGAEIGLEIFNSLKYSHHVDVFGASGKSDHASFVYPEDRYFESDFYVDRPDFIDRFNALLRALKIEFIYPTHDTVACFLAENQALLAARVLTSCAETNRIARYKTLTYKRFAPFSFCPQVFPPPFRGISFPVFLKPDDGQGGKGTHVAECHQDFDFYRSKNPSLLVTEFLPGEELSVGCFTDFNGKLLFVGPRTRERIQMGISFRSSSVELTDEIMQIAQDINASVALDGAWFFQVKQDYKGRFKLLEFAPRQSSTMGLYRHAGVNFALLTLFNGLRIPVRVIPNQYALQLDRCLHNRFKASLRFDRVYIDFDETMVTDRRVHEQVMAFVYQCRNHAIPVVLLTKHRHDLAVTLHECGISENLFESITQLSDSQDKRDFINPKGAIFIDNYWRDRYAVKEKFGIPVFDVDAVECLLR
jgi:hypothetical protein